jgi:hypothetical protein
MSSFNALASASVLIFIHLFHAQQIEYRLFYRIKLSVKMIMCYPQYPITPEKSNYAISYRVKIMILAQIVVLEPDLAHTLG